MLVFINISLNEIIGMSAYLLTTAKAKPQYTKENV